MQLRDRVVLVTGASRGLGRCLAEVLAARGARVACLARGGEALESTVDLLRQRGAEAQAYSFDLDDVEGCAALVSRVESELGPISALFCNAATATLGEVADCETSEYERHLRTNVLSSIALTRAALPGMRERQHGYVVYVLSAIALRSLPAFSTYATAKAALRGFADSLRIELDGSGVGLMTVIPGTMKTEGLAHLDRVGDDLRVLESRVAVAPEGVAERIVRGLERGRGRVTIRGPGWLVQQLDHFAPSVVDRLLARMYRRR